MRREYHINADEADLIDYNTDFGRDPGYFNGNIPFRSSDHDPLLVGLSLASTTADAGGPYEVRVNGTVKLSGTASTDAPGRGLTYAWDLDDDGVFDDAVGPTATFEGRGKGPGARQVHLQVTNSVSVVSTSTATVDVPAARRPGRTRGHPHPAADGRG